MTRQLIPDEDLASLPKVHPHEPFPVGETEEEQKRNSELLAGYDYSKYPSALTGYSGQNLQRIRFVKSAPAVRTRVGGRGTHKAGFAQLPNGKLIIAPCREFDSVHSAGHRFGIFVYESSDHGLTWQEIGRTTLYGNEGTLIATPDGTLIMTAQTLKMNADGEMIEAEHVLARSEDGGRTWEVSHFVGIDYPRNLALEPDGSVTMITALESDWSNAGTGSPNLLIRRSKDSGKTWESFEGKVDWNWAGFGEVGALRLKDGRLLATLRRQIPGTEGESFEDSALTESLDDGRTWSRPWQLTRTAQVHAQMIELGDGRLLCSYTNYHVPFGVSAMLSSDGGNTWDLDNTISLSVSNDHYAGWPVTIELEDGSLITSYVVTSHRETPMSRPTCGITCELVRWNLPQ
jgi:hypothetical protein